MKENKLPRYKISIDQNLSEDGEKLGITQVAYVENPAIITKGIYFNSKQLKFTDKLKLRVAAPALIPNLPIYRFDDEIGEYEVVFTEEVIEQLRQDFMLNKGPVTFNLDHNGELEAPSYILDSWITDDPSTDNSFTKYGVEVPKGSWFVVSQFTDEKYFQEEIIDKDRAAYSIEGFLGLALSQIKSKLNKEKMAKQKFEQVLLIDGTPIWISKLEIDGEVFLIDENLDRQPIDDGEYELDNGTKLVVLGGKITEVIEATDNENPEEDSTETTTENPEDKMAEEEMAEEEMVEEEMAEDVTNDPEVKDPEVKDPVDELDEAKIMEIIQPKLDEIYASIADLKTTIESTDVQDNVVDTEMSRVDRLEYIKNLIG